MALMPKRVKHRKSQRGRIRGNATRGNRVVFGDFGLQATQGGWISAQTIEAGRIAAQQYLRTEGRLVHPRLPAQDRSRRSPWKPAWARARASRSIWAAVVQARARCCTRFRGVTEEAARMCFSRLAHKMPVRVRFIRRRTA